MREAARGAAAQAEETGGLGRLGQPMNRRSPFFIGMAGTAGVAVTIGLVELVIRARSVLVIIGLALFIAVGLDPVVNGLTRRRVPRWAAVIIVLLAPQVSALRPVLAPHRPVTHAVLPRNHGRTSPHSGGLSDRVVADPPRARPAVSRAPICSSTRTE